MGKETTLPPLYRCNCGRLLRKGDILQGVCLGHQVRPATDGSVLEWLQVSWWKLTGGLHG